MMTLTWNGENELGSGCAGTGGLTGFGKEAVKLMEENGIIVDCSHLNDAGFEDLLNITKRPFVVSHSNLRSCCEVPRNCRGLVSELCRGRPLRYQFIFPFPFCSGSEGRGGARTAVSPYIQDAGAGRRGLHRLGNRSGRTDHLRPFPWLAVWSGFLWNISCGAGDSRRGCEKILL